MDKIDIYDIETYPKELEQMRINALTILEKRALQNNMGS